MKKLVFGLVATVAFSISGFAANDVVNPNDNSTNDLFNVPCTITVKETVNGKTYEATCTRVTCDNAYACAKASVNKKKKELTAAE